VKKEETGRSFLRTGSFRDLRGKKGKTRRPEIPRTPAEGKRIGKNYGVRKVVQKISGRGTIKRGGRKPIQTPIFRLTRGEKENVCYGKGGNRRCRVEWKKKGRWRKINNLGNTANPQLSIELRESREKHTPHSEKKRKN